VVIAVGEAVLVPVLDWSWRDLVVAFAVAFGLLELLVAIGALREDDADLRAIGVGVASAAVVIGAMVFASSWRWVAAGAWPVVVVVLFSLSWPDAESENDADG
jgi:hypothetical protein